MTEPSNFGQQQCEEDSKCREKAQLGRLWSSWARDCSITPHLQWVATSLTDCHRARSLTFLSFPNVFTQKYTLGIELDSLVVEMTGNLYGVDGGTLYDIVRQAYAKRAPEYVEALGSIEDMSPKDVLLISEWGRAVNGPVLDAGSGPGHWTDLLRTLKCEVVGLDMVSEFIGIAKNRFPSTNFVLGELSEIPLKSSSLGGILAWYSLIHLRPDDWGLVLTEFARTLRPGGTLLLGAFLGEQGAPFEHAIAEAYYWSEVELLKQLDSAGFQGISVHSRCTNGIRPHLDVLARRC